MNSAKEVAYLRAMSSWIKNKVSEKLTSVSPAIKPRKAKQNALILAAESSLST